MRPSQPITAIHAPLSANHSHPRAPLSQSQPATRTSQPITASHAPLSANHSPPRAPSANHSPPRDPSANHSPPRAPLSQSQLSMLVLLGRRRAGGGRLQRHHVLALGGLRHRQ